MQKHKIGHYFQSCFYLSVKTGLRGVKLITTKVQIVTLKQLQIFSSLLLCSSFVLKGNIQFLFEIFLFFTNLNYKKENTWFVKKNKQFGSLFKRLYCNSNKYFFPKM